MSDLLTHEEYVALASSLELPKSPFIDGKFRKRSWAHDGHA